MSKAVKTEVVTEKEEPVFDHEALSIMENKNGYHLVRIRYNAKTKEVGKLEILKTSDDNYDIMNEFEVRVEDKIL